MMVVAGCLFLVVAAGLAFGVPAGLAVAGVSLLAGAWLAEQALEGE